MKKITVLLLCMVLGFYYAQTNERLITKELIDAQLGIAQKEYYNNTNKALNNFLNIFKEAKSIDYKQGITKSCGYIISIYHDLGDDRKSIEYANILENTAIQINDNESLTKSHSQKAIAYSTLGLYDESNKEFQKAINSVKKYSDKNKQHYHLSQIYQHKVYYYENINAPQDTILQYLNKALKEAELMDDNSKNTHPDYKYDMMSYLNMNLGMFYTGIYKPQRLDLGEQYLKKSLKIINSRKFTEVKINKIPILNAMGRFYIEKNQFEEASVYGYEVLKLEKNKRSSNDRVLAFATLTNSYEGLKKKDSLIKYMNLYTNLTDSITHITKNNADTTIKKITSEKASNYKNTIIQVILIACVLILTIIIVGKILWKKKEQQLHAKYKIIKDNLQSITQSVNIDIPAENNINIIDNTINSLILKLKKFEQSQKFLRQDISLTYLANSLNTNTRYLSEVIKKHKGKNFNNYINGLRIHYITEMLYKNPQYREYKISYLAEACGFASREVFGVIFKKETGMTPSYFISKLKKENDENAL